MFPAAIPTDVGSVFCFSEKRELNCMEPALDIRAVHVEQLVP
jgi:hypothetical protein